MKTLLITIFAVMLAGWSMADEQSFMPQLGPQEELISSEADIVFTGGGAGGGKTRGLLMCPIPYFKEPEFRGIIFRRQTTQIRDAGGLWDESQKLYRHLGGNPRESFLDWTFPSGAQLSFRHMEQEVDRYKYDGSQVAFLGFDQVEQFSQDQFFYMLSRNRSTSGVPAEVRATCNPVPEQNKVGGWLHRFLQWWIDPLTGYAIPERSGIARWFVNISNEITWANTRQDLIEQFGDDCQPLSCAFVLAKLSDNPLMAGRDPKYRAKLQGLRKTERERLLGADESKGGNWNVHDSAGSFFQRSYFPVVKTCPPLVRAIRYWDRASTAAENAKKRSSHTAGVKLGITADNQFVLMHIERFQKTPLGVKAGIKAMATQDGYKCAVGIEGDPGQAGVAEAEDQARNLKGYTVWINRVHESKGKRAEPVSSAAENHLVSVVEGSWNDAFFAEAENYDGTDACVSDQIDALSGAYLWLSREDGEVFL